MSKPPLRTPFAVQCRRPTAGSRTMRSMERTAASLLRTRLALIASCALLAAGVVAAPSAYAHAGHPPGTPEPASFEADDGGGDAVIIGATVVSLLVLGGALYALKRFDRDPDDEAAPPVESADRT